MFLLLQYLDQALTELMLLGRLRPALTWDAAGRPSFIVWRQLNATVHAEDRLLGRGNKARRDVDNLVHALKDCNRSTHAGQDLATVGIVAHLQESDFESVITSQKG